MLATVNNTLEYFAIGKNTDLIYFTYPPASGLYGGVIIDTPTGIQEDSGKYKQSLLANEPLEDITGSIDFIIKGTTVSGISFFSDKLQDMVLSASQFWNGDGYLPTFFYTKTGTYEIYCPIKSASITFENIMKEGVLKLLKGKIEYTRKPLMQSSDYSSTTATIFNMPFTTNIKPVKNRIPQPMDLSVNFGSMSQYLPSGYLLFSNVPIYTFSGHMLISGTAAFNPPGVRAYDENANNAFSTYTDGVEDGVFGWTPSVANRTYVTSGLLKGNGGRVVNTPVQATTDVDIYATMKTTFSGTSFNIIVRAKDTAAIGYDEDRTSVVQVSNLAVPTVVYLGRISTDKNFYKKDLTLELSATLASGTLLIDQLTVHPITDKIASTSIFIPRQKVKPDHVPSSGLATQLIIQLYQHYFPSIAASFTFGRNFFPTLDTQWYQTLDSPFIRGESVPIYYGDIALYSRLDDIAFYKFLGTTGMGTYYCTFLATGTSEERGLNYWIYSTRLSAKGAVSLSYNTYSVISDNFAYYEATG